VPERIEVAAGVAGSDAVVAAEGEAEVEAETPAAAVAEGETVVDASSVGVASSPEPEAAAAPPDCGVQYLAATTTTNTTTTAAVARPIGMPPRRRLSRGAIDGWRALFAMVLHSLHILSYRDSLIGRLQASRGRG
jgi:hypothetical protein